MAKHTTIRKSEVAERQTDKAAKKAAKAIKDQPAKVINKKVNGDTEVKGNDVLSAMIQKDVKEVNSLLDSIEAASSDTFDDWKSIGKYLVKWKKASTDKKQYGALIALYCPRLDRRIINYLWKIAVIDERHSGLVSVFRNEECPHIAHPRTVWTRFIQFVEDGDMLDEINSLGERKAPTTPTSTKSKVGPKPGKESSTGATDETGKGSTGDGKDKAPTSSSLTGAKEFADRLQGYSMALNAITMDVNNGYFDDKKEAKQDLIKRLEAVLKALKSD